MAVNSLTYLGTTYTDANILNGSFSKSESLNMSELPVDTVELTIRPISHYGLLTKDNQPIITADGYTLQTTEANPLGTSFQQNTPIVQYRDGSQTAIWYLQSIERIGADIYTLNGISSLGRLTQRTHYGGIYNGTTAQTILADIMGDIPYYVDNVFKNVAVYGWLPIASARDNLQQLLFALNANLRTAADGTLRIENLSATTSATVAADEIFGSGANVKYNAPVTKVVVLEHQYVVGTDTKQLFDGTTTGNQTITFDEPMSALSASSGLTIVDSGANYSVVSGTGTLTGTPYIHMTREITKDVTAASVENIVRVENATLVGLTASADVINRLADYYACRNVINVAVAEAFLNVGDVASVFDPFDEIMRNTVIEKCQVALSNTPKSTISALVGFTPWQQQAFEDVRILIASGNSYTFPADIEPNTNVELVLIGGGDGGTDGEDGGNGESKSASRMYSSTETGSVSTPVGKGGSGGIGGRHGNGGKILRVSIVVNPNETVQLSVGQGGAANGGLGTASVFGTYSSDDGAYSDDGYYDSITMTRYASPGEDGVTGGKGADGGTSGGYGGNGENVEQYVGGSGGKGYSRGYSGNWSEYSSGGGGSGAVATANGINAKASDWGQSGISSYGANGVTPTSRSMQTNYGCGGHGGHGGSGGGGCGAMNYTQITAGGTFFRVTLTGTGGTGGSGGISSAGMQGCIIGYFRKPIN